MGKRSKTRQGNKRRTRDQDRPGQQGKGCKGKQGKARQSSEKRTAIEQTVSLSDCSRKAWTNAFSPYQPGLCIAWHCMAWSMDSKAWAKAGPLCSPDACQGQGDRG